MQQHEDTRPNPDPTVRGSAQLFHEIGALKEIFDTRLRVVERDLAVIDRRVGLSMFLVTTTLLIVAVLMAVIATIGIVIVLGS